MSLDCSACSTANPDGNRFCGTCGAGLASVLPASQAFRPLEEIKQVTVLFADVVGSTELVAGLDPEEAMDRLRPALATMRENIRRFDGTVAQTLGDGVMALFGAPRAQEGHALLACEAALAMQGAFPGGAGGVRIRIGLHSGGVVASAPLHAGPAESAVHGVTVHVASRLQAMASPSAIYLTEDCYRLVRPYCQVRPLGRQTVRGIAGGVEVYQLLGLRPAVTGGRFRDAALVPFLGRDRELGALQRALQAAGDGEASAVGIAGAPGTGKSRLCYEFSKWCRSRLIPVFEARAHPYGRAAPLQPVLEFFRRSLFRLLPSDSPAIARQRIASRLAGLEPGFNTDLPRLFEFLGIAEDDAAASSSLARLTPTGQRDWLLDLVRRMVRWFGQRPSLLVIEDLHWLDEASEEFVGAIIEAIAGTRTLLLLNYRPTYAASWMLHPRFTGMTLVELPASAATALVEQLVGRDPRLAGLRRRVAERSGGNPFFAEELVRSLVEEGALTGKPGQRAPGREVGDKLPTTVQAVIGARIDRLAASSRSVLQLCAVIGQEAPHDVLEQVSGTPHTELDRELNVLIEADLLQPLPTNNGPRSGFRHPMIQEVAYATQLKARRDALHAAVAAALNDHYQGRLDEFSALLSHHHEMAGQSYEAAQYAARAARWVGSNSPALAIRHWRKVRELLQAQGALRGEDALRIMASAQIAWLGLSEGLSAEDASPFIQEALSWAHEADGTMVPLLLFAEARIAGPSGAADTYVERVRDALGMLRPGPDDGRAATLYTALSQAYGWAGLQREALAASDAALARVAATERFDHEFLGFSVERWAKGLRSRILTRLGRFEEAQACSASMSGPELAAEDPMVRFIPQLAAADTAWFNGDCEAAEHHAAQVVKIASANNSAYLRVYAHEAVGSAKDMRGDHADAAREYRDALDIVRTTQAATEVEADLLARLAESQLGLGDCDAAKAFAHEGLAIAESRTTRMSKCRLCIILARAYHASSDPGRDEAAASLLLQAEELMQITGARLFENALAVARAAIRPGPQPQPGSLAVPG